jgi:hypothetical protein
MIILRIIRRLDDDEWPSCIECCEWEWDCVCKGGFKDV